MPDGSQWVPPSERTPGDRARFTIEKMSLNPGNVSQITAALKTASPNTKRVENGARLPSRRKISQMGRDLRQAVNQRQEVFGEWSNMTNYIRGTFIPHNLDRLRDGEPGILAFWQDESTFFVVVGQQDGLAYFSKYPTSLLGTDDKTDMCREKAPVKTVIMLDKILKRARPLLVGLGSSSPKEFSYLCAESLLCNRTCGDDCACAFLYTYQQGPKGEQVYRVYRECQTPPAPVIPAEFTLQSQENSACEFHVSHDMDQAAAFGFGTNRFGSSICDFHLFQASNRWMDDNHIPDDLARALDFGGHIIVRAPTMAVQDAIREQLKSLISQWVPWDDVSDRICTYVDHHYGAPGSPWRFMIGDQAGEGVDGYYTTAAHMESHFNVCAYRDVIFFRTCPESPT